MPNTREKLIELLDGVQDYGFCRSTVEEPQCRVINSIIADNLIANGVTVQKWIPVSERLPREGEEVLVFGYWHEKFQPLMCYLSPHRKGEWFTTVAGQQVYTVTHWMPLPEPPKGE